MVETYIDELVEVFVHKKLISVCGLSAIAYPLYCGGTASGMSLHCTPVLFKPSEAKFALTEVAKILLGSEDDQLLKVVSNDLPSIQNHPLPTSAGDSFAKF